MIAKRLYVRLGDNEWGNELMAKIAQQVFNDPSYRDIENLIVHVIEHAGWALSYLRDGTIVGSANDAAVFCEKSRNFVGSIERVEYIGEYQRAA